MRYYVGEKMTEIKTIQKSLMDAEPVLSDKGKTVADLPYFKFNEPVLRVTKPRKDGSTYECNVIMKDNVEYRLPNKVLADCKILKKKNVKIIAFQVIRSGTTKEDTRYTIMSMESLPSA